MANENCRSILRCKNSPGNRNVVLQRNCWILNNADLVAVALQDLVNALPSRAIHKTTMDQNDVCHNLSPPFLGLHMFGRTNVVRRQGNGGPCPISAECNDM